MKNTGKYETALMTLIPTSPKEWTSTHVEMLTAAATVDNLTDRIVDDSRRMAKKFESYATEVEARGEGWSPLGYSTLRDMEINIAKLEVHKDYLRVLVRSAYGKDVAKDFVSKVMG
jgi:hypothetical protein